MTSSTVAGAQHHVEHVMGMAVSIDIRDRRVPVRAIADVVEWLHHVDSTFSTYKYESPISALGRGETSIADLDAEIRGVVDVCEQMRVDTDGVFDSFRVPAPNWTMFDPSGLVKGWSIERAAELLEQHGCENFCLNAGGDIALRGRPTETLEWQIGIRHPYDKLGLALVIEAAGRLAIATSATYEKGAHIIDPRTGRSSGDLASATVVGPNLTIADAYATAAFVFGLEALDWIASKADYEVYLITNDVMTYWSEGFPRRPSCD